MKSRVSNPLGSAAPALCAPWTALVCVVGLAGCDGSNSATPPAGAAGGRSTQGTGSVSSGSASSASALVDNGAYGADSTGGSILDKNFDDIKFEMKKADPFRREMITPAIEALDGRRIRIRGYILPPSILKGLEEFVLVRDNQECCFGPGAALYDCIFVHLREGQTTNYVYQPIAVEGTFRIEPFLGLDDRPLAVYHLDGAGVK